MRIFDHEDRELIAKGVIGFFLVSSVIISAAVILGAAVQTFKYVGGF